MAISVSEIEPAKPQSEPANTDASAPKGPTTIASAPRRPKRSRVPLGQIGGRQRTGIPQELVDAFDEAGWHVHWANDDLGNLPEMYSLGSEHVLRSEIPEHLTIGDPNATGDFGDVGDDPRVRIVAGSNRYNTGPMFAYLMKKPKWAHEEQQAAVQANVDELEASLSAGQTQGGPESGIENVYGDLQIGQK